MVAEGGQDIPVDVHRAQQMVSELLGSVSYRNRDENNSIRVTLPDAIEQGEAMNFLIYRFVNREVV